MQIELRIPVDKSHLFCSHGDVGIYKHFSIVLIRKCGEKKVDIPQVENDIAAGYFYCSCRYEQVFLENS